MEGASKNSGRIFSSQFSVLSSDFRLPAFSATCRLQPRNLFADGDVTMMKVTLKIASCCVLLLGRHGSPHPVPGRR